MIIGMIVTISCNCFKFFAEAFAFKECRRRVFVI